MPTDMLKAFLKGAVKQKTYTSALKKSTKTNVKKSIKKIPTSKPKSKTFTTPDITQDQYLTRREILRSQDYKEFLRKLGGKGGIKRGSDVLNLDRPEFPARELTGQTQSGGKRKYWPQEKGKELHHMNPLDITSSIYRDASQAELNHLWRLQNLLMVPTGNDIRNFTPFGPGLHQKGKRVGKLDMHEWMRRQGIKEDYLDESIVNPTLEQREEALFRLAQDFHGRIRPQVEKMQFNQNQLLDSNKAIHNPDDYLPDQRYDRPGALEEAVLGEQDVHLLEPGRSTGTAGEAINRQNVRRMQGEHLQKIREDPRNEGFFNRPEKPGHDAAVQSSYIRNRVTTEVGKPLGGEGVQLIKRGLPLTPHLN